MKKITVILVALLLICGMSILSFAQTAPATGAKKPEFATEVVRGKIVSIDTVKNEIVVKEPKTGADTTISVDPEVISSLKTDENVKVTLKAGTNVADKVKEVVKSKSATLAPKPMK
jgi:hypothetical protein